MGYTSRTKGYIGVAQLVEDLRHLLTPLGRLRWDVGAPEKDVSAFWFMDLGFQGKCRLPRHMLMLGALNPPNFQQLRVPILGNPQIHIFQHDSRLALMFWVGVLLQDNKGLGIPNLKPWRL